MRKDEGMIAARLEYADVVNAAERIRGVVRPLVVAAVEPGGLVADRTSPGELWLACEYMQHSGSFKARGAANFMAAHLAAGSMPDAGVVIASGGNAALACAWAAGLHGVTASVFVPATAPAIKVAKLHAYGAKVTQGGTEYADAADAAAKYASDSGALPSHAYDNPLIAAGAGVLARELLEAVPDVDTIVVAVGGGGLFAGVATVAERHGKRVVAVEPTDCAALHAAIAAGEPVDAPVRSVAADSLGARRVTPLAVDLALRADVRSVLVDDAEIIRARQLLWDDRRIVVEHGAATALAALTSGAYEPRPDERVAVVLCGANTDPGDLVTAAR
jgi:threonine dehydratase